MTIRIEKPEFLFREQLNAVDSNIPVSKMPNGSVIQVATRHRQSGTYVSTNQSNYVDVTDLAVPITTKHGKSCITKRFQAKKGNKQLDNIVPVKAV